MAYTKWVVDPEHPGGYEVELTAEEEAQRAKDQQAGTAYSEALQASEANAADMVAKVRQRMDDLAAAADLVASGNATAQQQRDALALCLRTTARLARIVLRNLDVAV